MPELTQKLSGVKTLFPNYSADRKAVEIRVLRCSDALA